MWRPFALYFHPVTAFSVLGRLADRQEISMGTSYTITFDGMAAKAGLINYLYIELSIGVKLTERFTRYS